ncbi:MAG: Ltp family lipoprotein [Anaerovoracaceae bacterium]|jgi:hypothetical protein
MKTNENGSYDMNNRGQDQGRYPQGDPGKMTNCRTCGAQISKSAKVCPRCGARNKKPLYKRPWLFVLAAILVLCIAVAGCGNTNDTQTKDSGSSTKTEQKQEPKMTTAQKNAYEAAKNYLDLMPFSRAGLINQLSGEGGDGYDKADAEFAVKQLEKNKEVNWKEQAVKEAKSYLESQSFSYDGLVEQLESEYGSQFTHEQAVYGADKAYK